MVDSIQNTQQDDDEKQRSKDAVVIGWLFLLFGLLPSVFWAVYHAVVPGAVLIAVVVYLFPVACYLVSPLWSQGSEAIRFAMPIALGLLTDATVFGWLLFLTYQ